VQALAFARTRRTFEDEAARACALRPPHPGPPPPVRELAPMWLLGGSQPIEIGARHVGFCRGL
jgi:hypothetical protein